MRFLRWSLVWRICGPTTTALGKQIQVNGLTAEEIGAKLAELLKEIQRRSNMSWEEYSEFEKVHDRIEGEIRVIPWDEVNA